MKKIKFFSKDINVREKTVLIRLDLNVPLNEKKISDTTRIDFVIPFIKSLSGSKAKIVILSHLGRPNGKKIKEMSLYPIFQYLKKRIGEIVFFLDDEININLKNKISNFKYGDIILLENIRYYKEEIDNDETFAKELASLGDIYINDAFSCSHRKQASIHEVAKQIKICYAGPLLQKEISSINMIIKDRKEPITCILGGSKISTKIKIINNLIKNVQNIYLVGAMANNFFIYQGYNVGKSLIEKNTKKIIEEIYSNAQKFNCKIFVPIDCIVSKNFTEKGKEKNINEIDDEELILDIGPKTRDDLIEKIVSSKTILWNGPAGYFENDHFAEGTNLIAKKISSLTTQGKILSVVGGGDTISAINNISSELKFTHLSTAGGAFLEFLEGKDLPGLDVLK